MILLKWIGAESKKYNSNGLISARKDGESLSSNETKPLSPKAFTSAKIGSPSISLKPKSIEMSNYFILH